MDVDDLVEGASNGIGYSERDVEEIRCEIWSSCCVKLKTGGLKRISKGARVLSGDDDEGAAWSRRISFFRRGDVFGPLYDSVTRQPDFGY